jgi:hypothetical protein
MKGDSERHTVTLQRLRQHGSQYSGTLGKVGNCQIGVSVHSVGKRGTVPLGFSHVVVKRSVARADIWTMSIEPSADPDRVSDNAAVAALHELPGARILVFDRELRIILSAGQTLEHGAGSEPAVCREGGLVRDAFPESL